ncbi:MAG: ATP-dependent metallopeptidase FtsH/Yme1/Tma family protein, partial [Clostridium sp.]
MKENNKDKKKKNDENPKGKSTLIYFAVVLVILVIVNYTSQNFMNKEITYNEFRTLLSEKKIDKVVITSENLIIT